MTNTQNVKNGKTTSLSVLIGASANLRVRLLLTVT